jgi:hypothetical protein
VRTAPDANGVKQSFTVTHPFHPWRGRQFELVDCQRRWGQWQSQGRAVARVDDLLGPVKMAEASERRHALAPQVERAGHPAQNTFEPGTSAGSRSGVRGTLQHRAPAQRHRLHDAAGQAGGPGPTNLARPRRQTGSRPRAPAGKTRGAKEIAAGRRSGLQLKTKMRKSNLSIRRIGLCWEATRAPRRTLKPQAWAASVAQAGLPRVRHQSEKSTKTTLNKN